MNKNRSFISLLVAAFLGSLLLTLMGGGWGALASPTTLHAQDVLPADAAAVDALAGAGYNVELVGHIGGLGLVRAVAVQGDYAYLSADTSLVVLDVSLPTTPTVLTSLLLPSTTTDITIENGYAYVGTLSSGLWVVDVRNPAQPVAVGAFEIDKNIWDVAVAGRYAYVEGDFDGLLLVDVSNPAQPVLAVTYNPHEELNLLAAIDGYVYLSPWHSRQWLRIVDLSNPAVQPVEVGAYYTPYPGYPSDVEVAGGFAYVATWGSGLRVLDVSNPAQPVEVGAFDTPRVEGYNNVLYVQEVAIGGNFAYAGGSIYGLQMVDVSDPTQPVEVGVYDAIPLIRDFVMSADTLYVAAGEDGLVILRYAPTSYPVAGRVTNWNGTPLPGVKLSVSPTQTVVTDQSGKYTLSQLVTGTYTITPSRDGVVFEPPSRTFSVPPLVRGQDFAVSSAPIYSFSGGIYDTSFPGPLPFPDPVVLHLSNGTQTSSQGGFYSFTDLPPGSYVVTPTLADYSFYPTSREVTIPPSNEVQDFIVVKDPTLNILGTVRQSNGEPFAGVQVSLLPTTTRSVMRGAALLSTDLGISISPSTTTDAEGRYAFLNLEPGLYAVTAQLDGYILLPISRTAELPTLNEYPFTILPGAVTGTVSAGLTTTITLTDTQGLTTVLTFPPDALAAGVEVTVTSVWMPTFPGHASVHHAFELDVSSPAAHVPLTDFTQPTSVTVYYSINDTRTVSDTSAIGLWWLDAGGWVEADQSCASSPGQSHDEPARVAYSAICRPGLYALAGPTYQRLMPWVSKSDFLLAAIGSR
jgi:hypothetical protein